MAKLMVGTSGWVYPHWRGVFYPEDLRERDWFTFYSRRFDTVEINNSFYRLPSRETFESWRKMAPSGFSFTVKASRYITHVKKLKDPAEGLEHFYKNLGGMGKRCAAVLFQLPPRWHANLPRLEEFLRALPKKYRVVFEFRDKTWISEETNAVLRLHNAALCAADSPIFPAPRARTADFSFFRMHGGHGPQRPRYDGSELKKLAVQVTDELDEGRDCFVYFNNDFSGFAIENALELKGMLEGKDGGRHA